MDERGGWKREMEERVPWRRVLKGLHSDYHEGMEKRG